IATPPKAAPAPSKAAPAKSLPAAKKLTQVATPFGPSVPPQGGQPNGQGSFGGAFAPSDIQTAYSISPLLSSGYNGAGQTVAIIDAYDNPKFVNSSSPSFNSSDLHLFDQQFGLPDPVFTKVDQNGGTSYPGTDPQNGWEGEEALDVEWVHAIAPGAK